MSHHANRHPSHPDLLLLDRQVFRANSLHYNRRRNPPLCHLVNQPCSHQLVHLCNLLPNRYQVLRINPHCSHQVSRLQRQHFYQPVNHLIIQVHIPVRNHLLNHLVNLPHYHLRNHQGNLLENHLNCPVANPLTILLRIQLWNPVVNQLNFRLRSHL